MSWPRTTKLCRPNQRAYHYRDGKASREENFESITLHLPRRVDKKRGSRATREIREPVERTINHGKSASLTGEQFTCYDVFRGQIFPWSLNPITVQTPSVLQEIKMMSR